MTIKIIKQFEDHQYYLTNFPPPNSNGTWSWGLSDCGKLYCLCPTISKHWVDINDSRFNLNFNKNWSLSLMKRIVKEFGHLLIFV